MEFSPEQAVAAAEAAGIDLKKELFTAGALAAGMTAELEHGPEALIPTLPIMTPF